MDSTPIAGGNPVTDKYGYLNPSSTQQSSSNENLFIDLLVTQLKNQNPLEPMENGEFIQQMSSLASVQETQSLNGNIQNLIQLQEVVAGQNAFTQSANLVGKYVQYVDPATGEESEGYVDSIQLQEGGIFLKIGGSDVPMGLVTGITNEPEGSGSGEVDGEGEGEGDSTTDDDGGSSDDGASDDL